MTLLSMIFSGSVVMMQATPQVTTGASSTVSEFLINPFVLAILFFFLLGLVRIARYLAGHPAQLVSLKRVSLNCDEVERNQETDADLIKEDLLRKINPNSIIAQRVIEVHRISRRGGELDQVALAEILATREAAKVSIARYIASILVLLGLCGAIWGLSRLVFKMSPALQQVQEQLEQNTPASGPRTPEETTPVQESFKTLIGIMSDSLKNTRTAFYASLSGILTSVLLLLGNWFVASRQIRLLTEVEDLTATRLVPLFRPPLETAQLAGVVEAFREGSDYLVKLSKDLDDRQQEVSGHLTDLFGIVRKFREGADALEAYQKSAQQAQEQMLTVVNQFVGLTTRIEAHQAGAHVDLEGVVNAVAVSNKNLARAIEDWQKNRESLLQGLEKAARQAHAETRDARDLAQQGITDLAIVIRTALDNQVTSFRSHAIELFDRQKIDSREYLNQMINQQGEFVSLLQKSVAESDGHRALLEGLNATIKEERATFGQRMEKMLEQNATTMRLLVSEQQKILDITGLNRVEEKLERLVNSQSESGHEFAHVGRMLRILIGIVAVATPIFAALGVMFLFDLRPQDLVLRIVSVVVIAIMVFLVGWFLRAKS